MARERIVLDTNVLISALFSATSTPARVMEKAIAHGQLLASAATLRELARKLDAPKFDPYVPRRQREQLLQRLLALVEVVEVIQLIRASRDPQDDAFLEVAVNGRADTLISGDRDLLSLHPFRGIPILTPAAWLDSGGFPEMPGKEP